MPLGLSFLSLRDYFYTPSMLYGKSIQPSWKFIVQFVPKPSNQMPSGSETGPMPVLKPYHVIDVTLPTYRFRKETVMYGDLPRSFPVLETSHFRDLSVSLTMEEDELGTISFLINWLQRTIIDKDGFYYGPLQSRIGDLVVGVEDKNGLPIVFYIFRELYYLAADDVTYSYETNDPIRYSITFSAERIHTMFTKYGPLNAAQKALASGVDTLRQATGGSLI